MTAGWMVEGNRVPEEIGMVVFQKCLLITGKRNEGHPFAATALELNPVSSYLGDETAAETT